MAWTQDWRWEGWFLHIILTGSSKQIKVEEGPRKQAHSPLELSAYPPDLTVLAQEPPFWKALACCCCPTPIPRTPRNWASGQITNVEQRGPFHTIGWLADIRLWKQCYGTHSKVTPHTHPRNSTRPPGDKSFFKGEVLIYWISLKHTAEWITTFLKLVFYRCFLAWNSFPSETPFPFDQKNKTRKTKKQLSNILWKKQNLLGVLDKNKRTEE